MTTQLLNITTDLVTKFKTLSLEQQKQVMDYIEFLNYKNEQQKIIQKPKKRIAGLHKGQGWISDDFNEPLGAEFWGE